ncbi:MAG: hypothetical protein IPO67_10085 [Deltaproteobacteria bacterium]|nr:hypothetical protein [Deltaproteobacteria bacterium]
MTQNHQIIPAADVGPGHGDGHLPAGEPHGLYEETLLCRGVSLNRGREELVMQEVRVQDVMRDGAEPIVETATAVEPVRRLRPGVRAFRTP